MVRPTRQNVATFPAHQVNLEEDVQHWLCYLTYFADDGVSIISVLAAVGS